MICFELLGNKERNTDELGSAVDASEPMFLVDDQHLVVAVYGVLVHLPLILLQHPV